MIEVVFKTASAIIILNVVVLLVPEGRFHKYISFISGLVILAIMINCFKNTVSPLKIAFSDFQQEIYGNESLQNEINVEIALNLEQRFKEHINSKYNNVVESVKIEFDGEIKKIEIYLEDFSYIEDISNEAKTFFETDKSKMIFNST